MRFLGWSTNKSNDFASRIRGHEYGAVAANQAFAAKGACLKAQTMTRYVLGAIPVNV